ncbi:MAG: hypothetical protein V6Z81_00850 [Parvularculales bacterium]
MNKAILATVVLGSLLIGCTSRDTPVSVVAEDIQQQSWKIVFDPQSADPQAGPNDLDAALQAGLARRGRLVLDHCHPIVAMGVFGDEAVRKLHENRLQALGEWFNARGVVLDLRTGDCGKDAPVSFVLRAR